MSQEFIGIDDYNGTYQIDDNDNNGNFKVEIFASDDVDNDLNFTIYLNYQSAGAFSVTVIDGYVSGAEVIFDSNGDGLSDLSRSFYTLMKTALPFLLLPILNLMRLIQMVMEGLIQMKGDLLPGVVSIRAPELHLVEY